MSLSAHRRTGGAAPLPEKSGGGVVLPLLLFLFVLFAFLWTLSLFPGFAWGWTADYDGGYIAIERDSADAAGTVYVYGGPVPSDAQLSSGSWDETGTGTPFQTGTFKVIAFDDDSLRAEVPASGWSAVLVVCPDGRRQLVTADSLAVQRVNLTQVAGNSIIGANVPTVLTSSVDQWVRLRSTSQTIPVSFATSQSQAASLSLDGTLTVDPWVTANLPRDWQAGLVALLVLALAVHPGMFIARAAKRRAKETV